MGLGICVYGLGFSGLYGVEGLMVYGDPEFGVRRRWDAGLTQVRTVCRYCFDTQLLRYRSIDLCEP